MHGSSHQDWDDARVLLATNLLGEIGEAVRQSRFPECPDT
jgi:hypothetical protein